MIRPAIQRLNTALASRTQVIAAVLAMVLALGILGAARHAGAGRPHRSPLASSVLPGVSLGESSVPNASISPGASASRSSNASPVSVNDGVGGYKPGSYVPGFGTIPYGIHGNKITIVYYWKGDRTMTSPYLGATGQRGAVDEGDAFRKFIAYINAHANGGATFMGFPFNLHGRTIDINDPACPNSSCVLDAGQYPETYAATGEEITQTIKPFAAESSHGSLSDYLCPTLAKHHIFNPVTYDMQSNLSSSTNGWCLPQGLTWEKQVALSVSWLSHQARTSMYQATVPTKRVYGLLYAGYPGLDAEMPKLEAKLKAAGVNLADVEEVSPDLTTAGPEQKGVITNFKAAGVNTIITPESGSPITFTHEAAANAYAPDYFVWPCSGEDAAGQVRLYDAAQWQRASGLSCYDQNFNLDLTLDSNARQTQWFNQYREMSGSNEDPPATSPLVYEGLLPILAGLTYAGRDVTVEKFFAGIQAFEHYRYDAINGQTTDPSHFQVAVGSADGSQIGDAAQVSWSNTTETKGNSTPGAYVYSTQRYAPGYVF